MNMSITMAEDKEVNAADIWPNVLHNVHVIVGVFISVAGKVLFGASFKLMLFSALDIIYIPVTHSLEYHLKIKYPHNLNT